MRDDKLRLLSAGERGILPSSPLFTRRGFFRTGTLAAASGLFSGIALGDFAPPGGSSPARTLFQGGTVVTMDPRLGDFVEGDVLVEGSRIAAVGRNLQPGDARVIPVAHMIVAPGMIDTHRHLWAGQLRNSSPHGTEYLNYRDKCGPVYRPEDAYIGDTVSLLSALDAGVTTILDWSHIQNTPEHTDAVIQALQDSGIRAVFGYGWPMPGFIPWWENKTTRFPFDIRRLRRQYFASEDQLLTLALGATSINSAAGWYQTNTRKVEQEWAVAREVGARITVHTSGRGDILAFSKKIEMRADTTYVHCRHLSNEEFQLIADSGGTVSLCCSLDTLQGRAIPPIQESLDHGIRPSLSVDEEMDAPNDMFTQMRLALSLQRGFLGAREAKPEAAFRKYVQVDQDSAPPDKFISARDALEFATVQGARANGLLQKTGSLSPGKEADIVLLRKDRINVLPVNDPVGAIVLAMDTGNVDSVFVGGTPRKLNGQLVGVDLQQVASRAISSREYLLTKAKIADPMEKR